MANGVNQASKFFSGEFQNSNRSISELKEMKFKKANTNWSLGSMNFLYVYILH